MAMKQARAQRIRIMGIDPGIRVTGYGIIDITEKAEAVLCDYGVIRTRGQKNFPQRLNLIYQKLSQIIEQYHPQVVAVEDLFYSENVKTAIVLGHSRGVAILAAVQQSISVVEYSPREVKMAVVGNGAASKEQVQYMVRNLLNLTENIEPSDAADALATALCHWNRVQIESLTA